MVSKKNLAKLIGEYESLKAQKNEIDALLKECEDAITKEMERRSVSELQVGNKMVRWTEYVQNRFDSSAFKKAFPEQYSAFQKQVTAHRFSIS